jgi:hypothetical protein
MSKESRAPSGSATATYLRLALDARDVKAVTKLVSDAAACGMQSDLVTQGQVFLLEQAAAERANQIETVTFFIRQGMDLRDRDTLKQTLETGVPQVSAMAPHRIQPRAFLDIVEEATKMYNDLTREEISTIEFFMSQGAAQYDRDMLNEAISKFQKLTQDERAHLDRKLLEETSRLLDKMNAETVLLRYVTEAIHCRDIAALEDVLSKTKTLNMTATRFPDIQRGQKLLAELKKESREKKIKGRWAVRFFKNTNRKSGGKEGCGCVWCPLS